MVFVKDVPFLCLFCFFFSAVAKCWQANCPEAGVDVLFRHGRKFVRDRSAKSLVRVTELQFADDVALYTSPRTKLESAALKMWIMGFNRKF